MFPKKCYVGSWLRQDPVNYMLTNGMWSWRYIKNYTQHPDCTYIGIPAPNRITWGSNKPGLHKLLSGCIDTMTFKKLTNTKDG